MHKGQTVLMSGLKPFLCLHNLVNSLLVFFTLHLYYRKAERQSLHQSLLYVTFSQCESLTGIRTKYFIDAMIARHNQSLKVERNRPTFDFTSQRVGVTPQFQQMTKATALIVSIFDDDRIFTKIPIPPLILRLEMEISKEITSCPALTDTRGAP